MEHASHEQSHAAHQPEADAAGEAEKARMREVIAAPLKTVGASEASDVLEVKSRGTNGPVSAT